MSFLTLNGYAVPARDGTIRRKVTKRGRRERSVRGALRDARRGQKREWTFDVTCQTQEDADAIRAMVEGRGHHVDFADGMQASTGLVPVPGTGAVRMLAQAWGAFGRGVLSLPAATTGTVLVYPAQLDPRAWTVLLWAWNASTMSWDGYAKLSDGTGYKNGVQDNTVLEAGAALGVYPLVTPQGNLDVVKDGAALVQVDDLCMLPYRASTAQLAAWTTVANGKFGPAPVVRMSGDVVRGATVWVMGEVADSDFMGAGLGGSWHGNAKILHVTLREVDTPAGHMTTPVPPGAPLWWFDASNVDGTHNASLSNAASVSTWANKGSRGTGAGAGAPVVASRPTMRLIGETGLMDSAPSVLFDGTNDVMLTPAGAATADHPTWGVVFRADDAGSNRPLVDSLAGTNVVRVAAGPVLQAAQSATLAASNAPVVGTWSSVLVSLDGASSNIRFNGVDTAGTTGVLAQTTGVTIGANAATSQVFSGHIVEVVGWDGDVDADEWDAYVKAKYGEVPVT